MGVQIELVMWKNVGNGKETFFGIDPWIQGRPLKNRYPALLLVAENKKFHLKNWCRGGGEAAVYAYMEEKSDGRGKKIRDGNTEKRCRGYSLKSLKKTNGNGQEMDTR